MSSNQSSIGVVGRRSRVLAALWLLYGIARLIVAIWMAAFSGTAAVMFGALLNRVPNPYSLMTAFHLIWIFAVVLCVASGLMGILAGLALMSGGNSGRTLAVIAAILSVSDVPLGTTLGIYTLVAFSASLYEHAPLASTLLP